MTYLDTGSGSIQPPTGGGRSGQYVKSGQKQKTRSTPRKWTRNSPGLKPNSGSTFLYSADYPAVGLLAEGLWSPSP